MTHIFDDDVRARVLGHMNADHRDDNLLISRAFGPDRNVVRAEMTGFDGDGGDWCAYTAEGASVAVRVPWPGGSISERSQVRREIVALYDAACHGLGLTPRDHD